MVLYFPNVLVEEPRGPTVHPPCPDMGYQFSDTLRYVLFKNPQFYFQIHFLFPRSEHGGYLDVKVLSITTRVFSNIV